METTNWDSAQDAAPQHGWHNAETNDLVTSEINEPRCTVDDDEHIHAMAGIDVPDREDEDEDEEEDDNDDEAGDWGHVDPAESNSPFPDSNAPSAPGSAV